MTILAKAKEYVGLAITFLGKLLGLIKDTEKNLEKKDEETKPEEK